MCYVSPVNGKAIDWLEVSQQLIQMFHLDLIYKRKVHIRKLYYEILRN